MNCKEKDPEEFQKRSEKVCQTYLNAPALATQEPPTPTRSLDEKTGPKTGIGQALERASPDLPMKPGSCAKRE